MYMRPGIVTVRIITTETEKCEKVIEPNMMAFIHHDGNSHDIYMPKGTSKTASALFVDNNLEG
jgi:hypothetical protein